LSHRAITTSAAVLLVLGAALCAATLTLPFVEERKHLVHAVVVPLAVTAILSAVLWSPTIHAPLATSLDHLRHLTPARRRLTTFLIFLLAAAYFAFTAWRQHRDFAFRVQDERMFLLQIQVLARGRLWLPPHPHADFFQSIYIFTRPVYGSMYFPGASFFFVPAIWLHVSMWVVPTLLCAAVVAMTYRVAAELTDAVWGGLAALLVVAVPTVRSLSLLVHSYMAMSLLILLLAWAWLHWRRDRKLVWAAVIGLIAGWMAITRPLDALCFAVPIGVAMLWQGRRALVSIVISIACALPFLALQLGINHAFTAHWLQTPVQRYEELYWPGLEFGFHPKVLPGEHPLPTPLPQFRDIHDYFAKTFFSPASTRGSPSVRYALIFEYGLATPLLLVLIPASFMGLRDPRRRPLWIGAFVFPIAYLAWVQFIPHYARYYCAVLAPVLALAVVLGASQVARSLGDSRFISTWLTASLFALACLALPEFGAGHDKTNSSGPMQTFDRWARRQRQPALVFFHYPTGDHNAWRHEQVYNVDAADIDAQTVVRAQDLGDRNGELIRYYAARLPQRIVYLFENEMSEPHRLGTAAELAPAP
jgi:hypothetical protein